MQGMRHAVGICFVCIAWSLSATRREGGVEWKMIGRLSNSKAGELFCMSVVN